MKKITLQFPKGIPGILPPTCGSLVYIGRNILVVEEQIVYEDVVACRCGVIGEAPVKEKKEEDKPDLSVYFSKEVPGYVFIKNREGRMLPPDINYSNQMEPGTLGGYGRCHLSVYFKASDVFHGE